MTTKDYQASDRVEIFLGKNRIHFDRKYLNILGQLQNLAIQLALISFLFYCFQYMLETMGYEKTVVTLLVLILSATGRVMIKSKETQDTEQAEQQEMLLPKRGFFS